MRWLLLLLAFAAAGVRAETVTGNVTRISDGDTLTLVDENKRQYVVRLAEIDAPERGQPFASQSRRSLSALCLKKSASVEWKEQDIHKRYLGHVTCAGIDANAEQVRRGMAWVSPKSTRPGSPLFDLEAYARLRKIGLWKDDDPAPPWTWRSSKGAR